MYNNVVNEMLAKRGYDSDISMIITYFDDWNTQVFIPGCLILFGGTSRVLLIAGSTKYFEIVMVLVIMNIFFALWNMLISKILFVIVHFSNYSKTARVNNCNAFS